MTVEELIEELQQIEDKTLDVRVHRQGKGGYEKFGEVILVTSE